jgi:hypothetical protein
MPDEPNERRPRARRLARYEEAVELKRKGLTPGSLVPHPPPLHVVERGTGDGLSVAYMSLDTNRRRLCHLIGDTITLGRAARVRETSGAAGEGEGG